jgi:alkylmercury lyase
VLRRLVEGRPVPASELKTVLDMGKEEIDRMLGALPGLERDQEGRVISAFGLSLLPTPHVFAVAGRRLYAWCALDTMFLPQLLGKAASVVSRCPATGFPIRLIVGANGVRALDPRSAVMTIVVPESACDVRRKFCDHVSFFSSVDAARSWESSHPDGQVVTVSEAFEIGAELAVKFG